MAFQCSCITMERAVDCSWICENGDQIYLPEQDAYVTVQRGDSLWEVAMKNGEDPVATCQAPQNAILRGEDPFESLADEEGAPDANSCNSKELIVESQVPRDFWDVLASYRPTHDLVSNPIAWANDRFGLGMKTDENGIWIWKSFLSPVDNGLIRVKRGDAFIVGGGVIGFLLGGGVGVAFGAHFRLPIEETICALMIGASLGLSVGVSSGQFVAKHTNDNGMPWNTPTFSSSSSEKTSN